jgi:riboflavin synthase
MFTGLVQTMGTLRARALRGPGLRVTVATGLGPLEMGESIAVNGACLTVSGLVGGGFEADLSAETLAKTTLGQLPLAAPVNLERSLALGDRLGGHLVLGHVDGVARVERVTVVGEARRVVVRPPSEFLAFIASKGSVCLDGVSLTVNATGAGAFEVMLIPQTLAATTLGGWAAGHELNLEVDLLARYAVNWLQVSRSDAAAPSLESALRRAGFPDMKLAR